ncbi:hypothetical protein JXA84_00985 [candidate division WOR-3 bacterium]|nr:hypothetical protein [candidate division WOR-3 bacterium]
MKVCDLCNTSIGDDSIRYSFTQVKKVVDAGLRPYSYLPEFQKEKALSRETAEQLWVKQIMADNKDWFLCPECAVRFEKFLSE